MTQAGPNFPVETHSLPSPLPFSIRRSLLFCNSRAKDLPPCSLTCTTLAQMWGRCVVLHCVQRAPLCAATAYLYATPPGPARNAAQTRAVFVGTRIRQNWPTASTLLSPCSGLYRAPTLSLFDASFTTKSIRDDKYLVATKRVLAHGLA